MTRTTAWTMIALACIVPVIFMTWYRFVFNSWDGDKGESYASFLGVSAVMSIAALGIPGALRLSREKL